MTSLQPMDILLKLDLSLASSASPSAGNIVDSADPTMGIGDCDSLECP
jgi:hypothetical protein